MVEKVDEGTIEYVTKADLHDFQTTIETAFHQAIKQVKQETLDTMQSSIDSRLERERQQRESDMLSLKGELRAQLKEMDTKLDNMSTAFGTQIGDVNKGVAEIKGLMNSFQNILETRDQKDLEAHRRIEDRVDAQADAIKAQNQVTKELGNDVELLTSHQANTNNDIRSIRKTIHGDPENKDDAPSLFGILAEVQIDVRQGFINTNAQLAEVHNGMSANRQDIAVIVAERADEKARWSQRWVTVKEVGKAILQNRWLQLAIAAALTGIVVSIFPELREIVLKSLTNQIQNGG